jgi:hypothetical protein
MHLHKQHVHLSAFSAFMPHMTIPIGPTFFNDLLPSPQQFMRGLDIHSARAHALPEGPSSPDWFLGALLGPYE